MAWTAVCSKAMVLLLIIHCLVGMLCLVLVVLFSIKCRF